MVPWVGLAYQGSWPSWKGYEELGTSTAEVLRACQHQWADVSSWAMGRAGEVVGGHQRQSMGVALRHLAVAQAVQ